MFLLVAIFIVVALGVPIATGILVLRQGGLRTGGPVAWGRSAAQRFGRVTGAVVYAVAGWATVIVAGLGLGFLAKHLENSVDWPIFHYAYWRVSNNVFTSANTKLTTIGGNSNTELIVFFSIVILGCVYKRRWWIPTICISLAFILEKYTQSMLGKVVDRGHPPTTLGTFPSGGVSRILAVYSVVLFLAILAAPRLTRAWRVGLWTGLATAAVVEAYTRVYLSLHWFTDAAFALVLGTLMLIANVGAAAALAYEQPVGPNVSTTNELAAASG